jgi:hypothetical protein
MLRQKRLCALWTKRIGVNGIQFTMSDFLRSNPKNLQIVELLCTTAQKGLADCYSGTDLSGQGIEFDNRPRPLSMALNLRYVMIAQIGIKRWLRFYGNNDPALPDLGKYISTRIHQINRAGDIGLAIWADAKSSSFDCGSLVKRLVNNRVRLWRDCDAVELAWVLQAMVNLVQNQSVTDEIYDLLKDVRDRLLDLHCSSGLFARHNRGGFKAMVSRRVASFADQVYPILALADYGRYFNDPLSVDVAVLAADTICRLQGADGQWWWHYDVKTATVAEEYPVFSVHQDAMAPMALLAVDEAAATDHSSYIEKGLRWLNGQNELCEKMIKPDKGVIWRDIHRREIGKMYRWVRDGLIAGGLRKAHQLAGRNLFGFSVNRQCRPYHLGWILYAWAGRLPAPTGLLQDSGKKEKIYSCRGI